MTRSIIIGSTLSLRAEYAPVVSLKSAPSSLPDDSIVLDVFSTARSICMPLLDDVVALPDRCWSSSQSSRKNYKTLAEVGVNDKDIETD